MMNYIIFPLALFSVHSVYARSHVVGDMVMDDYQFYKLTGEKQDPTDSDGSLDNGISLERY